MNADEKKNLKEKITASHTAIQKALDGIDLELPVHQGTEWRIRDILGHIATWDCEVIKSLRAFMSGIDYSIPDLDEDETDFNGQAVAEQRKLSTQRIVEEWHQARSDVKAVINDIPNDKFPGDLLYPWGEDRGSIGELIDFLVEHDEEHRDEIVKAIQNSP